MSSHLVAPKGARFSPDRPGVGYVVVALVMLVMLAAMAFSFIGLYESAEWTRNPQGFWWLAPVIIDGPILVYTASYAIWRWRGVEPFAHHAMRVLIFFTGLSVIVNAVHVASGWEWAWMTAEMYAGIVMAAVAPVGALLAAHEVTRLVFMQDAEAGAHTEEEDTESLTDTVVDTVLERLPDLHVLQDDIVERAVEAATLAIVEPEPVPSPFSTLDPDFQKAA